MRTMAVALVVLSLSSASRADDAELTRRIEARVGAIAKAAERQQLQRLLVVVREVEGSRSDGATLERLRAIGESLVEQLKAQDLEAFRSSTVDKLLAAHSAKQVLEPRQVAELQSVVPFDALVAADYSVHGNRATVRIVLVDGQRRRLVETVRMAHKPSAGATLGAAKQKKAGGGSATLAGSGLSAGGAVGGAVSGSASGVVAGAASGAASGSASGVVSGSASGSGAGGAAGAARSGQHPPSPDSVEVPVLNQRVVRFAVDNLGKQVGNGECWTLAAEALIHAGAQPARGYTFGREIARGEIQPGDVLQFDSARFDLPNNSHILMGQPHHTAVVYSLNGDQVFVLHQNFGKRSVSILDFDWDTMTQGTVQAYRPVPAR